MKTYAHLW